MFSFFFDLVFLGNTICIFSPPSKYLGIDIYLTECPKLHPQFLGRLQQIHNTSIVQQYINNNYNQ